MAFAFHDGLEICKGIFVREKRLDLSVSFLLYVCCRLYVCTHYFFLCDFMPSICYNFLLLFYFLVLLRAIL